jgi:hypothetical protein
MHSAKGEIGGEGGRGQQEGMEKTLVLNLSLLLSPSSSYACDPHEATVLDS